MSSPNKRRQSKSGIIKNNHQKSINQKSEHMTHHYSKQCEDKQPGSNYSQLFNQNGKKYPKSPFLKKPKRLLNEDKFVPEFSQQMPTQYIKIEPLSNRFTHKKGRSMDFEQEKIGFRFGRNQVRDSQAKPQNKKIIITDKLIDYLKCRSSQSEMKDYMEFGKNYFRSKQISSSNAVKPKIMNPHENKPSKKTKKSKKKINLQSDDPKKTKKCNLTSRESHKIPFPSNSGDILKNEFRSMDLSAYPRSKSSLRDKRFGKASLQLRNTDLPLPFPSKLNSLYSNTTSLFNSKAQLEPFVNFYAYRIPSQQPQNEIVQIRKFQSLALSAQLKSQDHYEKKSPIKQLSEKMLSFAERTQDIIRAYITTSFDQPIVKSESLIIEQCKSFERQISGVFHSNQNLQQQLKQVNLHQQFDSQSENKLNTVIKLISQTNSLGEEKKQLLLAKIRQIIPIAKIGSREIERDLGNQRQADYLENKSNPTQSLKSSFAENECIQILNIRLLDQTLRERQKYLKERLEKEIKRLQDRKQMAIEDFQSQKKRLNKWINSQIKQTMKTRIQLWKGLNFANKLLQNKSQKDLKRDEMMKCLSQKIIRNHKLNLTVKSQNLEQRQVSKINQTFVVDKQISQPFQIATQDLNKISVNTQQKQQNLRQKQQRVLSGDKHNVELLSSSEYEASSFRKNFIFTDSAQKIDYDFDDTSPIPESPTEKKKINQYFFSQLSGEHFDSLQQNSAGMLILQLSPANKLQGIDLITQQDKQDIFQFIFLDLCIQMKTQSGQQCTIMNKINSFIVKLKERAKRPRGFQTNPNTVKDYLKNFINFLNKHRSYLNDIHQELQRQMGPTSLQILRYLHPIMQKNCEENENLQPAVVLDIELFQSFEKEYVDTIQISNYYEDELQEKRRKAFIRNSMHVHHKAIFDAFNEELDRIRPFGQWGKPFQWKKVPKFEHKRTSIHKNKLILQAAETTINFSHYMCGFLIDKEQCSFKDNPSFSQVDVQKVRSNRLKTMLTDYMHELQQKLMFIDDEEVELLVDIEEFIFEKMIKEVISFMIF